MLCTQITKKCCDDLEALRPGVLTPVFPGAAKPSKDLTGSGNSRNVACAGTVLARVTADNLEIDRLAEHRANVDAIPVRVGTRPLCRGHLALPTDQA